MGYRSIFLLIIAISFLNLATSSAFLLSKEEEITFFNEDFDFELGKTTPGSALLAALVPLDDNPAEDVLGFVQDASLAPAYLVGFAPDNEIIKYEVQLGDSPSTIAARFGVSTNSVLWSNGLTSKDAIFPGQELSLPPVTGLIHKVAKGETVSSIALRYEARGDDIASFNDIETDEIQIGQILVIPEGKVVPRKIVQAKQKTVSKSLPKISSYFINPTIGTITQGLHPNNAVDIANKCDSTPVYAAASGRVTASKNDGWNGGAGQYIKIDHPNGTATLYAHLNQVFASLGQNVTQGEKIGVMGNTGRVRGPTGCHLHFSVYGAKNPLAG